MVGQRLALFVVGKGQDVLDGFNNVANGHIFILEREQAGANISFRN